MKNGEASSIFELKSILMYVCEYLTCRYVSWCRGCLLINIISDLELDDSYDLQSKVKVNRK